MKATAELFKKREAYFTSKFDLVQTFKLVAKAGSFDGMVHERLVNGRIGMVDLQKENRVFCDKKPKTWDYP